VKAVICGAAGSLHLFTPGSPRWAVCQCKHTAAWWEDPEAGKIVVASRTGLTSTVRGLGLNNQLLLRALASRGQAWQDYRAWHDIATDAPGYVFDKAKAACWAVVFLIGSTTDSRWATPEEVAECFLKEDT
jgi:hypothetical protein